MTNSLPMFEDLRVLVVEDEEDIRTGLARLIATLGAKVSTAADGVEGLDAVEAGEVDLVLTDMMMPRMSGSELLGVIKDRHPQIEVVILTGFGTIQSAVGCLQAGAAHFMTKPFDNKEVLEVLSRLGRQILARRGGADGQSADCGLVANDPAMVAVMTLVRQVAASPVPVLIEGMSGTGKEVIAREIHRLSAVQDKGFSAVNTAALPDTLLESELFGHERGAFTGAQKARKGIFREAGGGTVFLDEISSMSGSFQGKLLRVLQEKTVRPLGADVDVDVDFRLIAASNKDLETLISDGEFREDLFYRLSVVRICLPLLRERVGDIGSLANLFLGRALKTCLAPGALPVSLSAAALHTLEQHSWPGNVRELENVISRAVVVCGGQSIQPHHLGLAPQGLLEGESGSELDYAQQKQEAIEQFQREFVQRAMTEAEGNISRAADLCGLTRAALQRIMRQLGIDRTQFGPR